MSNSSGTCKVYTATELNSLTLQSAAHGTILTEHPQLPRANGVASTKSVKTPPQVESAAPTQTRAWGQLHTVEPPAPLCSLQTEPLDPLPVHTASPDSSPHQWSPLTDGAQQGSISCHTTSGQSSPQNNASGETSPRSTNGFSNPKNFRGTMNYMYMYLPPLPVLQ